MSRDGLNDSARRIASMAALRATDLDHDGAFPDADIADLHAAGLLLAPFPPALGGLALGSDPDDPTRLLEILVEIGSGSLSLGRLYEGHVNAVKLVAHYGSTANLEHSIVKKRKRKVAPAGSGWPRTGEPLRLEGRVLAGRKILASGSGRIQRPLIAARSDIGSIMVIPRIEGAGRARIDQWTVHGMRATATGYGRLHGDRDR